MLFVEATQDALLELIFDRYAAFAPQAPERVLVATRQHFAPPLGRLLTELFTQHGFGEDSDHPQNNSNVLAFAEINRKVKSRFPREFAKVSDRQLGLLLKAGGWSKDSHSRYVNITMRPE